MEVVSTQKRDRTDAYIFEENKDMKEPEGNDSLVEFPIDKQLHDQTFNSMTICLRVALKYGTWVGLLENLAGVGIKLSSQGYGFVHIICDGTTTWFAYFLSKGDLPIKTFVSMCISITNEVRQDTIATTNIKAVQNEKLWSNSTHSGARAASCNFTVGSSFYLGGVMYRGKVDRLLGTITDLNVWSRALTVDEMVKFTSSYQLGREVSSQDKIFDWESYNHTLAKTGKFNLTDKLPLTKDDLEFGTDSYKYVHITYAKGYEKSRDLCEMLGGQLPMPKNQEELTQLLIDVEESALRIGVDSCETGFRWLPITQEISNEVCVIGHYFTYNIEITKFSSKSSIRDQMTHNFKIPTNINGLPM